MNMNNFHRLARRLTSLLAAAVLAGCASGPAFVAPEAAASGNAVIYVYRLPAMGGAALKYPILVDGAPAGSIGVASYLRHELRGPSMRGDVRGQGCVSPPAPIVVAAGQIGYVEAIVEMSTLASGGTYLVPDYRCRLVQRTEVEALKALPGLRRAEAKE